MRASPRTRRASSSTGRPRISTISPARGINTNGYSANLQSAVAIYVDELPISANGNSTILDPNLFDVERVEFLRGPQGTLFGSSSLAGAMRIITRSPDLDEFQALGARRFRPDRLRFRPPALQCDDQHPDRRGQYRLPRDRLLPERGRLGEQYRHRRRGFELARSLWHPRDAAVPADRPPVGPPARLLREQHARGFGAHQSAARRVRPPLRPARSVPGRARPTTM